MATVEQNIGQTLEEQNLEFYCDCIDRKRNEGLKTLPRLKQIIWFRLRERKALGWAEVHKELEKIPFCKRRESFVKAMFCVEHDCGIDGICVPCMRKENINHYVTPDIDEYKNLINCIELCDDDLEHEWIQCKLKKLDPMREIIMTFY